MIDQRARKCSATGSDRNLQSGQCCRESGAALKSPCRFAIALLIPSFCLSAQPQSSSTATRVFQIGTFDGASDDFAHGAAAGPVKFVVGQNDSLQDWPATQLAAPASDTVSVAAQPRTIEFALTSTVASAYRLHIALLIESRGVPALRVGINGKYGVFYLNSGLEGHTGNLDDTFESLYVPADVDLTFPGRFLRRGSNIVTLQAIDHAVKEIPDASLTYDAIELDSAAAASTSPVISIRPAVYYKGQEGNLQEQLDVFLSTQEQVSPADWLELAIGSHRYRQNLARADFGEQKLTFWVPQFPPGTHAEVEWQIAGKTARSEQSIDPQKKWTLLIVPHIHVDVGFSDYQPKVAAIQGRVMDEAMDLADSHPGFVFSVDGAWDLDQFLKTRTPDDQQRVVDAMKNGRLFVPAQYADLLTGFPTVETLIRSLYMSARFSQIHSTPFDYANITDVPSYSWSYASVLAAAGLHELIAGPNGHETRAPVLLQGHLNEHSPFWWVGPDGGKVLFWYSRHYWEGGILFGVPPEADAGREIVPLFLNTYERPSYKADAVILYGTQVENTDLFPEQAVFAAAWNREFAYPRLRYSGFSAGLKSIAAQFGSDIPTVSGDGGPYWEDGIASNARTASLERRNESRAPSVDKLATLASLVNPRVAVDKSDLDRMWTNMVLMDEHTWNSHDSVSDPKSDESRRQSMVKAFYALDARQAADYVVRNSMANLADAIPAARGSLIVFNTLNWNRSALVSFDLPRDREIADPATGATVPVEVISESAHLRHVRFLAKDVPGMGYKIFTLRFAKQKAEVPAFTGGTILENSQYRVELDPATGAVRSIFDKELNRELVNQQSPYRFGQYLYVSGGDHRPNTLLQYRTIELQPHLEIDPAHGGHLLALERTPYGWSAHMQSTAVNTPTIATEIRLFDSEKKIEFIETIDKTPVASREAVYFTFPFAMNHPRFTYEIQNGVVDPALNMYPGAGHEWFSVQHWVSVQQDQLAATVMPLDAPLVTLGDIYRGSWPSQFGDRRGTIFSYAMNNYWSTNYDAEQGGPVTLRYVITSAPAADDVALSRMGWENATPLELDEVTAQDKAVPVSSGAQATADSFLMVNDPAVLVEDWKPSEDGKGTVLRLLDLGGPVRQVKVRTSSRLALSRAIMTDAVERDQKELKLEGSHAFEFPMRSHQIATVRLIAKDLVSSTHVKLH